MMENGWRKKNAKAHLEVKHLSLQVFPSASGSPSSNCHGLKNLIWIIWRYLDVWTRIYPTWAHIWLSGDHNSFRIENWMHLPHLLARFCWSRSRISFASSAWLTSGFVCCKTCVGLPQQQTVIRSSPTNFWLSSFPHPLHSPVRRLSQVGTWHRGRVD